MATLIPRPSLSLLAAEPFRAASEFVLHKLSPSQAGVGDGHPVVIFPGLAADASSVAPLRDHCRSLGYAAVDWGRGANMGPRGDIDAWLAELAEHVSRLLPDPAKPATLIGGASSGTSRSRAPTSAWCGPPPCCASWRTGSRCARASGAPTRRRRQRLRHRPPAAFSRVARRSPLVAQLAQFHEHRLRIRLLGQLGKTFAQR